MADNTDRFELAVDEYLRQRYHSERRSEIFSTREWDADFTAELADLGLFALAVPDSFGGLGQPMATLGPVFVELGRHLAAGPLLENSLLPALLLGENADQAPLGLTAAIETGQPLALVDPGITADWSRDVGAVVATQRGLHGTVHAVRFAQQAGLLVVIADHYGQPQIQLVDPEAAGVRIEHLHSADPTAPYGRVIFDGAAGEPLTLSASRSMSTVVNQLRSWARLLIACELSGIAYRCLALTVEYIQQRKQFGRQIGSFQAVKHIAANMHARSAALHNLCMAAIDDAERLDDDDELFVLAAGAKAYASTTAQSVCEDALQLHGGIGFTTESELHWYYKRALVLRAWYGDTTELEVQVGSALLDRRPGNHPLNDSAYPVPKGVAAHQ